MFDSSSPDLSRHLSRDLGRSLSRGLVTPVFYFTDYSIALGVYLSSKHGNCFSTKLSLTRWNADWRNATVLYEQAAIAFRLAKDNAKAKLAFEKAFNVTGALHISHGLTAAIQVHSKVMVFLSVGVNQAYVTAIGHHGPQQGGL